jgi:hypothetical protein
VRISKGFLAAGWARVTGGDVLRNAGTADAVFIFDPNARHVRTHRIRVGKRLTILERRIHRTPTKRCSRGRWERIDDAPTPSKARAWTRLGEFWAWRVREGNSKPAAGMWDWSRDRFKDKNRCSTPSNANAHRPTGAAGSCGGGRILRSLPGGEKVLG